MKRPDYRWLVRLVLLSVLVGSSGCSTVKGWLRPWVCADGACESACKESQKPSVVEKQSPQDPEDPESEGPSDEAADETRPKTKGNPYELVDAFALKSSADLKDKDVVGGLKESFSSKKKVLESENFAVRGRFTRRGVDELAIVNPESEIVILNSRGKLADRDAGRTLATADALPHPVVAGVRVVRDGRLEIIVLTQSKSKDTTDVFMSIYKVIGREVARVFDHKVGEIHDGAFVPFFRAQFLRGDRDIFIEIAPVREGVAVATEKKIYHWNHWEGMFRIPSPPPPARKRS